MKIPIETKPALWGMPVRDPEYYVEAFRQRATNLGNRPIAAVVAAALLLVLGWSTWFTVQPEDS